MYKRIFKGAPLGNDNASKNHKNKGKGIAPSGTLTKMLDNLRTQGGFTYHPSTDSSPTEGMAVSPFPEHTKLIPLKDITAKDIKKYVRDKKAMFKDPMNHVGAWVSEGNVFLDVTVVAKTHDQALKVAKTHDQIAYFDLKEGKEVTVNKHATSGGVVNTSKRSDMETVKKAEKPALHLMPAQGMNTESIAQMYKSLTGKDMTAEERAEMDAEFAADAIEDAAEAEAEAAALAAKQAVKKSNLRI